MSTNDAMTKLTIENAVSALQALQSKIDDFALIDGQRQQAQGELASLKRELDQVQGQLRAANRELGSKTDELSEVKDELAQKQETHGQLASAIRDLRKKLGMEMA